MSANLTLQSTYKLSDGHEMPVLGLGVYEMTGDEAYSCVLKALEIGYRHVDSAAWYENEQECGKAILDFLKSHPEVKRENIFYTTKLRQNVGYEASLQAIRESVDLSGLGYVDLYLVHGPLGGPAMRSASWKACLKAQELGLVRSIGVSNYGVKHLQEMQASGDPLPTIDQVDLHPFQTRPDIVELCKKHDIILQAWAPLVRGMRFNHPVLKQIASQHNKSTAQVLLRYSLQKGFVPLPKSVKAERIASNADIFDFDLSTKDIQLLDSLDEQLVTDWEV
ncbi:Aldo/keto reductase [Sistotremastrum niveocremeum HHB9708]|uniref:Aldo/keto reductase n=1 Tax=Sistotremastrum niveocremeum HHB9708 TaxID=1314777 RepID=A0A164T227_9AGAM|nr:Aldo/keto reductase [Sistotremastrum niveocremeum HHB9708]